MGGIRLWPALDQHPPAILKKERKEGNKEKEVTKLNKKKRTKRVKEAGSACR